MNAFGISITSKQHHISEDAYICDSGLLLFAVFDGVGGGRDGEIAAKISKEIFINIFNKSKINKKSLILQAFLLIKKKIAYLYSNERFFPATTASVVTFENKNILIGHLGDSRVYGVSKNKVLKRLTLDDSILNQSVKEGVVSEDSAQKIDQAEEKSELTQQEHKLFQLRYMILNYLSGEIIEKSSTNELIRKFPNEDFLRILLTTDGVHDNLTDRNIKEIITDSQTPKASATKLVNKAYTYSLGNHFRSKPDDITAVVIDLY